MPDELYRLTGDSIAILDLFITDCENGILTLRHGYTNESLVASTEMDNQPDLPFIHSMLHLYVDITLLPENTTRLGGKK